jgi:hypothetical protein
MRGRAGWRTRGQLNRVLARPPGLDQSDSHAEPRPHLRDAVLQHHGRGTDRARGPSGRRTWCSERQHHESLAGSYRRYRTGWSRRRPGRPISDSPARSQQPNTAWPYTASIGQLPGLWPDPLRTSRRERSRHYAGRHVCPGDQALPTLPGRQSSQDGLGRRQRRAVRCSHPVRPPLLRGAGSGHSGGTIPAPRPSDDQSAPQYRHPDGSGIPTRRFSQATPDRRCGRSALLARRSAPRPAGRSRRCGN